MMKTRSLLFLAVAALCIGSLLWVNAARSALLDNDDAFAMEPDPSAMEIYDGDVPLTGLPDLEPAGEEEDPFTQFTQEQRDMMNEVLGLVNAARTDAGLAPLELDPTLCGAAQVRAKECVTTFSHTRPNGTRYKTAIEEAGVDPGIGYSGENAATGQTSAKQVVESWLRSEGHRANILNANYTRMGIGFEPNTGNRYRGYAWAQLFVG